MLIHVSSIVIRSYLASLGYTIHDAATMHASGSKPDFVVIGAHKSATTWLYEMLKCHPDIYLPPEKELHYLDRSSKYKSPTTFEEPSVYKRYSVRSCLSQCFRIWDKSKHATTLKQRAKRCRWYMRYYFGNVDNQWYTSLFDDALPHQISGEITPAYSMLFKEDIQPLYSINPDIKIVFLLRNPIERCWSHLLMDLRLLGRTYHDVTEEEIYAFFESESYTLRTDYLRTIQNWSEVFSREQLYIGLHDDVKNQPKTLICNVLQHLGLSVSDNVLERMPLQAKYHVSKKMPIPDIYREYLRTQYGQLIDELYKQLQLSAIKLWQQ